MITVHFPNETTFSYQDHFEILYNFSQRYGSNSNLYGKSGYPEAKGGYFQVTEISEDKRDVWVEWFKDSS